MIIAKRNIKLFFRDRAQVFFSLLSVFIIIGLYVLFLGKNFVKGFDGAEGAVFLVNSWVIAGILAVISVTSTLGAFGVMVEDKAKKVSKDFNCAPVKRSQIAGGYILSSYLIGVILSIITFLVFEFYIVATGGELLPVVDMLKVFGLILLSVASSSAMMLFMVSLFKSQNAFSTASTVVGTLIGFLVGMYINIGSLPEAVQFIMKLFPTSHAGVLFRQVLLKAPMEITFAGAPAEVINEFNYNMGVVFQLNGTDISFLTSILYLLATTVVFYLLSVRVKSKI